MNSALLQNRFLLPLVCAISGGLIWLLASPLLDNSSESPTDEGKPSVASDSSESLEGKPAIVDEERLPPPPSEQLLVSKLGPPNVGGLEQADRLLRGGNYTGALVRYRSREQQGDSGAGLSLRLGLANELSGNLSAAANRYTQAIQQSVDHSIPKLWALVGLSRTWLKMQDYDSANSLLNEFVLRFGSDDYPEEIRASASLLLAESVRLQNSDYAFSKQLLPMFLELRPNPDHYLIEDTYLAKEDDLEVPEQGIKIIQMPGENASSIIIAATLPSALITNTLRILSLETRVKIQPSEAALARLSGRRIVTSNRILTLAEYLDYTLSPHGLVWNQEGGMVAVSTAEEVSNAVRLEYIYKSRGRILRTVQVGASDRVMRCLAFMHEGNDLLLVDDITQAEEKFIAAKNLTPLGELGAALSYNRALLRLGEGRANESLDSLYNALDQTLDPALKSHCYLHIAKQELALGRLKKAVVAASRGTRVKGENPNRVPAIMVLAKAYLLDDKPHAANDVLFEGEHLIENTNYEPLASVLAGLARVEIVGSSGGIDDEVNRLLRSLSLVATTEITDYSDLILISRAYFETGLKSRAWQLLEDALERTSAGFWRNRLNLELAQRNFEQRDVKKAMSHLVQISGLDKNLEALQLKGKVRLLAKDAEGCIATCRQLLEMKLTEDEASKVLTTLGRAFQLQGRDMAAATCFSGVVPDWSTEN